jgi:hypothetical protein
MSEQRAGSNRREAEARIGGLCQAPEGKQRREGRERSEKRGSAHLRGAVDDAEEPRIASLAQLPESLCSLLQRMLLRASASALRLLPRALLRLRRGCALRAVHAEPRELFPRQPGPSRLPRGALPLQRLERPPPI